MVIVTQRWTGLKSKATFSPLLLSHTSTSPQCEHRVCGSVDSGWNKTNEKNLIKLELEVNDTKSTKFLRIAQTLLCLVSIATMRLSRLWKSLSEKVSFNSLLLGRWSYTAVTSCWSERWVISLCKLAFVCPFFPGGTSNVLVHSHHW